MEFLPAFPRAVLAFVVVLGVLVFIHELGHYLAARWRGVHVERFSVGFGRAIYSWTDRRGCEWRIGWLPLGGYVKMHGMEQPDARDQHEWRAGESFHEKPVGDRAIVVAAGPIANFLLAILLFAALFMTVGRPTPSTVIGTVVEGGAAAQAGLVVGDRVVSLDGERIARFDQIQRHIQPRAGQPVELRFERAGEQRSATVVPAARPGVPEGREGMIGIGGGGFASERLDPFSAVWAGTVATADIVWQTLVAVGQMLTGARGTEDLGGPLRIAELSGEVASVGLDRLVTFIAVLSVNLALINLFPIPILDGGHLVFYAVEAIRGRPISPRAMEYGFRAGFALLITLFVFATWNDLAHGAVGRWVAGLVG